MLGFVLMRYGSYEITVCCDFYAYHIDRDKLAFVKDTGNFKRSAIKDHIILHSKPAIGASVKDKQNSDHATAD